MTKFIQHISFFLNVENVTKHAIYNQYALYMVVVKVKVLMKLELIQGFKIKDKPNIFWNNHRFHYGQPYLHNLDIFNVTCWKNAGWVSAQNSVKSLYLIKFRPSLMSHENDWTKNIYMAGRTTESISSWTWCKLGLGLQRRVIG